jgi:hypothetical protein
MNLHTTRTNQVAEPRGSTMKFTYPSGSRPLDGFTLKRGIGRGGFGEVYFATSDAGKEVALKLIRRNLEVELRGVRQCLNLKHPNLVGLYDIKNDSMDDRWVVMEHVAGESLEEAIERNPNGMPVDQVLYWMHGIVAGVAYLHDHGIVHRDLKPGNIFSDEEVVKIGDYGLSKFISCSRRSGQTESVGTVHYMAPEIANGRYGREIDTYALGIILYEMLLGQVPFEGESVGEVLMKHLTAQPDLSKLDEPYRAIVAKALAKDPELRLTSAAELQAMLPPLPPGATPPLAPSRAAWQDDAPASAAEPPSFDQAAAVRPAVGVAADTEVEPVYAAVRRGWHNLETEWQHAKLPPALRVAIIIGAILLLIAYAGVWGPLLFLALIGYGVYWVVRTIVVKPPRRRHGRAADVPPVAVRAAAVPAATAAHRTAAKEPKRRKRRWHQVERATLVVKPPKQKLMELTGSMLFAAAIVVIMSVVMMILRGAAMRPEQFAWLALVGTFGAWAVMVPAKVWEGQQGDHARRRFVMLVVGLLIGIFAYTLATALMVELPINQGIAGAGLLSHSFFGPEGAPTAMAYLAYFGFLLLILRWWCQVDPTRSARLSLWATGTCVFWAWLLSQFWQFPQPWGLMLAAVISIAVQLASPWLPPSERKIAAEE